MITDEDREPESGGETFIRVTNAMVYAELQATRSDVRDLAKSIYDYPEIKQRVRRLEKNVYSILAGLTTGIVMLAVAIIRGG